MASIAPPFHQRKLSSVPLRTNAEDSDTDSRLGDPSNDVAHVLSAERREALQQIDRAIYSPIHLRIVLVAGVGFLAEAYVRSGSLYDMFHVLIIWCICRYDIFAIGVASHMLGYLYGEIPKGELPGCNVTRKLSSNDDLSLKVATSAGTLVGHLLFGWAADVWGRKRMCTLKSFQYFCFIG
jgi:PHS family inorganic phosphate transporter-like MFS transporter